MIRAIQDFEPMKMFTPNEYILLGHPNSRQFVEDPLVQDESNVVEVRIAPPDGFLIKRDPIKMNAMEHTVVRTTSSVSEKISSPTLFISGDLDQEPIIEDNNNNITNNNYDNKNHDIVKKIREMDNYTGKKDSKFVIKQSKDNQPPVVVMREVIANEDHSENNENQQGTVL